MGAGVAEEAVVQAVRTLVRISLLSCGQAMIPGGDSQHPAAVGRLPVLFSKQRSQSAVHAAPRHAA